MLLFPLYATKYFLVRILLCNKQKYPIKRNIYHDVNGKWFSTGKIHELKTKYAIIHYMVEWS